MSDYRGSLVNEVEKNLEVLRKALQDFRNLIPEVCRQSTWIESKVKEVSDELSSVLYVKRDTVLSAEHCIEAIAYLGDYNKKVKGYVKEACLLVLMPWFSPPL
jgi:hypothetical protein